MNIEKIDYSILRCLKWIKVDCSKNDISKKNYSEFVSIISFLKRRLTFCNYDFLQLKDKTKVKKK